MLTRCSSSTVRELTIRNTDEATQEQDRRDLGEAIAAGFKVNGYAVTVPQGHRMVLLVQTIER